MPRIIGNDIASEGLRAEYYRDSNRLMQKRFTIGYDILGDSIYDREDQILDTPALPQIGQPLRGAWATKIAVEEVMTHALLWRATVDFDSATENRPENLTTPPDLLTPEWNWDFEEEDEILERDAEDDTIPIVNTANEQLIMTHPVTIMILNIERWENVFNEDTVADYANHANSVVFWKFPIRSVRCAGIRAQRQQANTGDRLWRVRYVFKIKIKRDANNALLAGTWQAHPLNQGTKYKENAADHVFVPFLDQDGNPTKGNLDTDATALADDDDPVFLTFNRYPLANFNNLSLGPFE